MLPEILAHVEKGSQVHSDEFAYNWKDGETFAHNIVNHTKQYVDLAMSILRGLRTSGAS